MTRRAIRPKPTRREQLKETLRAIPWGSATMAGEQAIATGPTCGECGNPVGEDGHVSGSGWARCRPCITAWAKEKGSQRVAGELVRELVEAGVELPRCRTCRGALELEGKRPPLVFVDGNGEISGGYCRSCTEQWRAQQTAEALRREILDEVGKGRNRGLVSLELVKRGRQIADVRDAFDGLITEGALISVGRGILRRPTRAQRG